MSPQRTLTCWICHNEVPINECKFDEFGKPVHEKCSLERVALLNATRQQGTLPSGASAIQTKKIA
jgi:hypothetical protein